ncbi:hypothetical protein UA08_03264 [Talaromyces atroroseus]|uniref:L-ascorbate oxidase n=1 Tax=Talaromyces atroroseus TaxID=1441469 RepID=A0A225AQ16_TALAT|nr:hypothetical protein UA08_03264 [Talaromyces atroroseus]OKL61583.1 hypothetical protein UA08_03264 [Talaromyces atroroseus]
MASQPLLAMWLSISLRLHFLLASLPLATALRQVMHDSSFQPDYVLRITGETISVACRTRASAVVNETAPGPTVYLRENQTTWVRVYNDLNKDNATIHWHGLSQSVAPYSDGTPQASQWPIREAQHFFDYELRPQIGEAGTYFYHSHVAFQAVSAAGPLIVLEADGEHPYDYDEERMLFFSELYNNTDDTIQDGLTLPYAQFLWSGEAETILVNGNGFPVLPDNETGATLPPQKAQSIGSTSCGPEIIQVEPNKTYRFRAIGGVAMSPFVFAFENHDNLTVIAADAGYTNPASTDYILMGAGQRYDFLLHTKTEEELRNLGKSEFWVPIEPRCPDLNNTFYAVLRYTTPGIHINTTTDISSPPPQSPVHIPYDCQYWLEYTLEPLTPNDFPTADQVTRQVIMTSAQLNTASGSFWTISNHTWNEFNQHEGDTPYNDTSLTHDTPYLVSVYEQGERAIPDFENAVQNYNGWDPELNVYPAEIGEIIDIILVNEPNGVAGGFDTHPWHFHGAHFYDLGSGPGSYNATANEEKLRGYNPIVRDTSLLFKYTEGFEIGAGLDYTSQGWRAWRVRVTDPGIWIIHCHILQHMIMGMQAVWVMGNATEITHGTTPDLVEGYLTYGGNAYGNSTVDPLVTHFYD